MSNAKYLVWLGNDTTQEIENENGVLETVPVPGPSFMSWAGLRFNVRQPTLVDPEKASVNQRADWEHILKKAPNMPGIFKVLDRADVEDPIDDHHYDDDDDTSMAAVALRKAKVKPKRTTQVE